MQLDIPFNKICLTGDESIYLMDAINRGQLAGDGYYTKKCHEIIRIKSGSKNVLLTHSCTAALEMAALLVGIKPGDEIIMPSYTFSSTANAFVLRGGIPVFVDIRSDTLNLDEGKIESAITENTKAIVPVHYAGVACEMDKIVALAKQYSLFVIEDAAQAEGAYYKQQSLGGIGDFGCYSFHETKNIVSGEGGALLVNLDAFRVQAEMIREKGTDRSRFCRGEIDKYTWQTIGSSYLPSELVAAFLLAQLENLEEIKRKRKSTWEYYYSETENLEKNGYIRRPIVPVCCEHNAHMFYILLAEHINRKIVLQLMREGGVRCASHYIPLHVSPAGQAYGRVFGSMKNTTRLSEQIIRLPFWIGMTKLEQQRVINLLGSAINASCDYSARVR